MTLRSQTAALTILLVALAIVFVLVGETGVSTGVFLPEPTLTYTPTVGPTPTPLPDPAAENWTEIGPNQWTYAGDTEGTAQLSARPQNFDTFVTTNGLTLPAEDSAYPLLDVLGQMRTELASQAEEMSLELAPDAFTGPQLEIVDGVPVAMLRVSINAQENEDGQAFPGLDLAWAFIERGENEISFVEYAFRGDPDPVVYNDFRAWLEANIANLAGNNATDDGESQTANEPGTEAGDSGAGEAGPDSSTTEETSQPDDEAGAESGGE